MVPEEGIEPTRCYHHQILSLARLPVPPLRPQVAVYYARCRLNANGVEGADLSNLNGGHAYALPTLRMHDPVCAPPGAVGWALAISLKIRRVFCCRGRPLCRPDKDPGFIRAGTCLR